MQAWCIRDHEALGSPADGKCKSIVRDQDYFLEAELRGGGLLTQDRQRAKVQAGPGQGG